MKIEIIDGECNRSILVDIEVYFFFYYWFFICGVKIN